MERQRTFGLPVAVDVFLGGAGGGVFLISYILATLNKYEDLVRIGAIVGPLLVGLGALVLFADLGVKTQMYRLFFNPLSWMSRGSWFIMAFIPLGLIYALPALWLPAWTDTVLNRVIGAVAAALGIMVIVYPGYLLGVIKRVPFWNRASLPVLFLFSGVTSGIAILLIMGMSWGRSLNDLVLLAISLIIMQALLILVFFQVAGQGGPAGEEAVRQLRSPLFIIGVAVAGLALPALLLAYHAIAISAAVLLLAGLLLLAGNLIFRYCILCAGVRIPLYPF